MLHLQELEIEGSKREDVFTMFSFDKQLYSKIIDLRLLSSKDRVEVFIQKLRSKLLLNILLLHTYNP